jgi:hypothetical protein
MTTKIDYFGDFISEIVISEDRLEYLISSGVEIISKQSYSGKTLHNEETFIIQFKVTNLTFLHFMNAGIKYGLKSPL